MGSYIDTLIHRWENILNTWVVKIVEHYVELWCPGAPAVIPKKMLFFSDRSTGIRGAARLVAGASRFVAGAPRYSDGRQDYPPHGWYSPEIDASKFTLHILSDTAGGFQLLKYISLRISASKCISTLGRTRFSSAYLSSTRSRLPSASLSYSISAFKCISKPARSMPPTESLGSIRSRHPSASPNSLECCLQLNLPVHTITASKCISKYSQSLSPGAPAITLQYRPQPDWPYVYI